MDKYHSDEVDELRGYSSNNQTQPQPQPPPQLSSGEPYYRPAVGSEREVVGQPFSGYGVENGYYEDRVGEREFRYQYQYPTSEYPQPPYPQPAGHYNPAVETIPNRSQRYPGDPNLARYDSELARNYYDRPEQGQYPPQGDSFSYASLKNYRKLPPDYDPRRVRDSAGFPQHPEDIRVQQYQPSYPVQNITGSFYPDSDPRYQRTENRLYAEEKYTRPTDMRHFYSGAPPAYQNPQLHALNAEQRTPNQFPHQFKRFYSDIPVMKFSSFPIFACPSSKNVCSSFAQVDTPKTIEKSSTLHNPPFLKTETGEKMEVDISRNCIIFHPGSRNLRIGFANDPFPKEIPHVIARELLSSIPSETGVSSETKVDESFILEAVEWGESQLLERLQNAKRKPSSNASSQVLNFNSAVEPTPLPDHNDPYRGDWSSFKESSYLIGDRALRLPENGSKYLLRYPLKYGKFNTQDYSSLSEVRADLETLWSSAIQDYLELPIDTFEGYSIGLVVPDQFCPVYVSQAVDIFLNSLGFFSIFLIQESVSATFGAGISSACVVNIGAQVATVACVEEGRCIPSSRVAMPFGGDDLTLLLMQLLIRSKFPYPSLDLSGPLGWSLAETLKKQLINYKEHELSVYLSYFFVPTPGKPTLKYELKVYDEGFIAPMLLFNPKLMDSNRKNKQSYLQTQVDWVKNHTLPVIDHLLFRSTQPGGIPAGIPAGSFKRPGKPTGFQSSTFGHHSSAPLSFGHNADDFDEAIGMDLNTDQDCEDEDQLSQALSDSTQGIDKAIVQSIQSVSADEMNTRRWFSNILVAGGGAGLIPGFVDVLEGYLRYLAPFGTNVEVLSSVRDLDPRDLCWKGAAVYSKLDIAQELHVNFKEWNARGIHSIQEKTLFSWPFSHQI